MRVCPICDDELCDDLHLDDTAGDEPDLTAFIQVYREAPHSTGYRPVADPVVRSGKLTSEAAILAWLDEHAPEHRTAPRFPGWSEHQQAVLPVRDARGWSTDIYIQRYEG